jgi:hypothetical protein
MFMFAIAAGFIAGEGLGGVFNALLAIVKADGSRKFSVTVFNQN